MQINFRSGNRSHAILARRAFSAIRAAHNLDTCTFTFTFTSIPFSLFPAFSQSVGPGTLELPSDYAEGAPKRWKCASNRRFHRRQDFSPTRSHFSPLLSPLKHRSSFQSFPRAFAACAPGRESLRCVAMGTLLFRLAARRGARQNDRRGVRRDARSSGPSASFAARAEPHRRGSERVESRFGRDSRGRASRPGQCPAVGGTPCVGGGSCRSARDRACTGARPRSSVITCPRTVETSA
jgi:hypothetical protein